MVIEPLFCEGVHCEIVLLGGNRLVGWILRRAGPSLGEAKFYIKLYAQSLRLPSQTYN